MNRESTRWHQLHSQVVEFDRKHPEVWELFCDFTLQLIKRGFKNYSAHAVIQRVRWETDKPSYKKDSKFKINNNFFPFYARWFMEDYPEHEGFFRTRRQFSKDRPPCNLPPLGLKDCPSENDGLTK